MLAAQVGAIHFEVMSYEIKNDLTVQQHTTGFQNKAKGFISTYSTIALTIVLPT